MMNSFSASETDPQPDWAHSLPREVLHEIMRTLQRGLPPPGTDDPAERAERDRAALAAVVSLLPETAFEGRMAAQAVVADAWGLDCLRLAQERYREFDIARKCKAQASSLMREAKSALRELRRLQSDRGKRAKDEAASGRAEWVAHAVAGTMAEVLMEGGVSENDPGSRDRGFETDVGFSGDDFPAGSLTQALSPEAGERGKDGDGVCGSSAVSAPGLPFGREQTKPQRPDDCQGQSPLLKAGRVSPVPSP